MSVFMKREVVHTADLMEDSRLQPRDNETNNEHAQEWGDDSSGSL
jgi:hypothetical protein